MREVRCGDCRHFLPNPLHEANGVGTCRLGVVLQSRAALLASQVKGYAREKRWSCPSEQRLPAYPKARRFCRYYGEAGPA